jgi:hypothetical protein
MGHRIAKRGMEMVAVEGGSVRLNLEGDPIRLLAKGTVSIAMICACNVCAELGGGLADMLVCGLRAYDDRDCRGCVLIT